MRINSFLIGSLWAISLLLIFSVIADRRISTAKAIAPYLGIPSYKLSSQNQLFEKIKSILTSGDSAPWASDKRVLIELRKCSSQQSLASFRFEQLIFALLALLLTTCWIFLKVSGEDNLNPVVGFMLLPTAFFFGGAFRSWLLKETARKRIREIDTQLPAVLDLLAFSVAAGEPILASIKRVSQTCSGELSVEIQRITTELSLGENFLVSLERIQKELGSQSLARAFRALIMAIERGTPIAEVLRAQAMDARNLEARKLMTLAGKKETLMMIPVVFLILPMIVIVALYPGLMALQTF